MQLILMKTNMPKKGAMESKNLSKTSLNQAKLKRIKRKKNQELDHLSM